MLCRLPTPSADTSRDNPACRSRRGEAPEGSPDFSPGVEARSAEDPGKRLIIIIKYDPDRVSHSPGKLGKCDTLSGSWGFLPAELSRGLRRGLRPSLTPGLKTVHPCRGAMPPTDPVCRYQQRQSRLPIPQGRSPGGIIAF